MAEPEPGQSRDLRAHCGDGILTLIKSDGRGERWIDATRRHALMLYELTLLFPGARFVRLVRNGRYAVDSLINSGFPIPEAKYFRLACMTWRRNNELVAKYAMDFPERVIQIRYEDLFQEHREEVWRGIFKFPEIAPKPACLAFSAQHRINSSFGNDATRRAPREIRWSAWRRMVFDKINGRLMIELGCG